MITKLLNFFKRLFKNNTKLKKNEHIVLSIFNEQTNEYNEIATITNTQLKQNKKILKEYNYD